MGTINGHREQATDKSMCFFVCMYSILPKAGSMTKLFFPSKLETECCRNLAEAGTHHVCQKRCSSSTFKRDSWHCWLRTEKILPTLYPQSILSSISLLTAPTLQHHVREWNATQMKRLRFINSSLVLTINTDFGVLRCAVPRKCKSLLLL